MKVLSNELKIAAEGVDPFTVRKLEKKQRIVKNQMHQIKNLVFYSCKNRKKHRRKDMYQVEYHLI